MEELMNNLSGINRQRQPPTRHSEYFNQQGTNTNLDELKYQNFLMEYELRNKGINPNSHPFHQTPQSTTKYMIKPPPMNWPRQR